LKGFIIAVTNFMPVYSLPRPSTAYCMMPSTGHWFQSRLTASLHLP